MGSEYEFSSSSGTTTPLKCRTRLVCHCGSEAPLLLVLMITHMVVGGIFREENATFPDGMTLKCLKDKRILFELC